MIPDVNVQFINFPSGANEMVVPNDDGSYTILINGRLSDERQKEVYLHALKHIQEEDFNKFDVQKIEASLNY